MGWRGFEDKEEDTVPPPHPGPLPEGEGLGRDEVIKQDLNVLALLGD